MLCVGPYVHCSIEGPITFFCVSEFHNPKENKNTELSSTFLKGWDSLVKIGMSIYLVTRRNIITRKIQFLNS